MKTRTLLLASVVALSANMSLALTNDEIIADLKSEGFTRIEIKSGPTQVKAEAIRGNEKHEIIYDAASGKVLKREVDTVDATDDTQPGVEVETEDGDFVGTDDSSNDENKAEDDSKDDSANDDSGNDDSGKDDSGNDDSGSDDSGNDDSGNDDSGSDHSGSDHSGGDHSGSDHSGGDDSGSDD